MNAIATIISLTGLAWAMGPDGKSRLLAPGDTISAEETLVTASTTRIELDFGDGRVLVLRGSQVESGEGADVSAVPVIVLPEFEEGTNTLLLQQQGVFNDGHAFVQLVKIAEIIEADGITPLTVSAIKELLNPLAMGWDREPEEPEEERYNRGGDNSVDVTAPGVAAELLGSDPDGVYNQAEIGEDGTVTAQITLLPGTDVGDNLTVTDKDGNVLLERPVTEDDLTNG
ncbi:hypothetical protein, partial [Oceanimonas smirnovii]|uniref:hypothetical protein n=1 Tax=Oceanimonas smirnovii TaxID=264574 RepID=UPI00376F9CC9